MKLVCLQNVHYAIVSSPFSSFRIQKLEGLPHHFHHHPIVILTTPLECLQLALDNLVTHFIRLLPQFLELLIHLSCCIHLDQSGPLLHCRLPLLLIPMNHRFMSLFQKYYSSLFNLKDQFTPIGKGHSYQFFNLISSWVTIDPS